MKNLKTKLTAVALSTLMTVSAAGAVTASAAEVTEHSDTRTVYFINNKEWKDVYSYTWSEDGSDVAFPGKEIFQVGTTDILGTSYELYAVDVYTDECTNILFDQGFEHGQQSSDIDLTETCANCFYLDKDNKAVEIHAFSTDQIDVPVRMAAGESSNINCLKSDGNNVLFINTTEAGYSTPVVKLTNLNGTTTEVNAVAQSNANGKMAGMYYVQIPQGNYIRAEITVNGKTYTTDITDTTDTVKISNGEAMACQRVFFNNDLSTKNLANQNVKAYAWNSKTGETEVSEFTDAKYMTYYQNVYGSINQYFYDVPLAYNSIIFLTSDCNSGKVTVQTVDINLNYTTNTSSGVVMDGYAPTGTTTNGNANVSLFNDQVVVTASNI